MVVTIRSLSLQMAFAQRFNEVTCDITHISSSYNLFDARLKSFDTWTRKEGIPSPESLAEAGFFYRGKYMCLPLQKPHLFPSITLSKTFFTRIKHFVIFREFGQRNVFSLWHRITRLDSRWWCLCWTRKMVALLCFLTFVKGKPFIDECRRLARQNGTGDILTVALNEWINLKYTPRCSFFINPIPDPMSQEMIILKKYVLTSRWLSAYSNSSSNSKS